MYTSSRCRMYGTNACDSLLTPRAPITHPEVADTQAPGDDDDAAPCTWGFCPCTPLHRIPTKEPKASKGKKKVAPSTATSGARRAGVSAVYTEGGKAAVYGCICCLHREREWVCGCVCCQHRGREGSSVRVCLLSTNHREGLNVASVLPLCCLYVASVLASCPCVCRWPAVLGVQRHAS